MMQSARKERILMMRSAGEECVLPRGAKELILRACRWDLKNKSRTFGQNGGTCANAGDAGFCWPRVWVSYDNPYLWPARRRNFAIRRSAGLRPAMRAPFTPMGAMGQHILDHVCMSPSDLETNRALINYM